MVTSRRGLLPLCLGAALAAWGCNAAAPVPDFDESPTVALLITPEPPPPLGTDYAADSGLYAILVTTGTPLRSPYLRADRFEMRRVSDGARFAWRPIDPPREVIPAYGPYGAGANYFLPRRQSAGGLGSDSIAPGAEYELVAEAGPHRIVGRTRVPRTIQFVREATDGDSVVRWRRVPGAAAYILSHSFPPSPTADTSVVIYRGPPIPGQPTPSIPIRLFALDSNYAAFAGDIRASRAGITGGWGVFGSYTWADTELPSATATVAPR